MSTHGASAGNECMLKKYISPVLSLGLHSRDDSRVEKMQHRRAAVSNCWTSLQLLVLQQSFPYGTLNCYVCVTAES